MKKHSLYIWLMLMVLGASFFVSLYAKVQQRDTNVSVPSQKEAKKDSINLRYPVSPTQPRSMEDINAERPMDLKSPENVKSEIEYDVKTGRYLLKTKMGDDELGTSFSLSPEEYMDQDMRKSMHSYFRSKNKEEFEKHEKSGFNLADMQFNIGPAERIFGPGGVRIQTQGSLELTVGMKQNKTMNPTLPVRQRNRLTFNFDEQVQMNVTAKVGEKVSFGMNYNTQSTFNFDTKKIKLAYEGNEDEIIKNLEAGNVSMTTSNSLIRGGAALFGIKANLQFGKLKVGLLASQQESESKTVNSKGGVQTTPFEFTADQYDENRNFFLSYYFRNRYDQALSKLPYINSPVVISKVEVWITNKRGKFDQARNIVAFTDLGEYSDISNDRWQHQGSYLDGIPYNDANTLYKTIVDQYPDARDINQVTQVFQGVLENGTDYEKIESARRLEASEYYLNTKLGYISLKTALQPDEVLAVAYQYTYQGKTFQVGEFSTDITGEATPESSNLRSLYVKLLKGTALTPSAPYWDLMMKNVYSLGAYSVQKEKFRLDIQYLSDTTGLYLNYIPAGKINLELLLRVMNLDRLDSKDEPYPDGFFDFVEGYTILSQNGKIIFPVVEPFGSHLRKMIDDDAIADKFVYQELYDTTKTVAQQFADKNKFLMKGEYKASKNSEISLGASNVARGSVRVTAGGVTLTENTDYVVDYTSGRVTILNQSIIDAGTPISVSLENQSMFSMQRKTMLGMDLNYEFSPNFNIGGTIMHLYEVPLTMKIDAGNESLKNTLWGFNTAYRTESQLLTNLLDKLPLLQLTKPSLITFNAEFAHLIPGHYENKYGGGYSYLDDFESAKVGFDLRTAYPWNLCSVPYDNGPNPMFPEATLSNDVKYGYNRALLAWYSIDPAMTRKNSSIAPSYIREDVEQLSNHFVREVYEQELFPNRQASYGESAILPVLNLAYYPKERGPYNMDVEGVANDGSLANPEKRFGGMMRKLDQTNFESSNIEYIEFWMMDPFIYDSMLVAKGGDLYLNLGEISEDILKDGMKSFESGLPVNRDPTLLDTTVWGKVPKFQSTGYAFDNSDGAREIQDVGLDGLSTEEEFNYPSYKNFIDRLRNRLPSDVYAQMQQDRFSPFNDPAMDNFHYFRGAEYDRERAGILTRYKRYNGTEGNSDTNNDTKYSSASKAGPDVEDINQDNTLNENEAYYEYKISIRPKDMKVGENFIADKREATVRLRNGQDERVTWYQFKIPVREYTRTIGRMEGFNSIRFMRVYMTNFTDSTILRLATFQLIRGEWRVYTRDLSNPNLKPPTNTGKLDLSAVNIEENSSREPVNYVLPPGVTRILDPSQPQIRQQNEQSMSLKVLDLESGDARAAYKTAMFDLRQYKRLQMFVHAEKLIADNTNLANGDLSIFLRLGSDFVNNYYEYEVPLTLTPAGVYNTQILSDQQAVWPEENMINIPLSVFTDLKLERNREKSQAGTDVTFTTLYSKYDPDNTRNRVAVIGNPSLSEVKTIMIGVRNNSRETKSGVIWVDDLRLTEFNEDGGWAANANLNVALSDLGTVNLGGRIETAGFGGLDQSLTERRLDDLYQYNIVTNVQFGKFFPEKAKVSIPFYYGYSNEKILPKYNPIDQDILLQEALDNAATKREKDSINDFAIEKAIRKSFSISNMKVDIKSKNPMPYDPANFSLGFAYSLDKKVNPTTEYETTKDIKANLAYSYTPFVKPYQPFSKMKNKSKNVRVVKEFGINYLPSNISFQTAMARYYYELQLRDMSGAPENVIPVSFKQDFLWDRRFSLRWDLTKNLSATFNSGTNARIEEPHVQVNKDLNKDQYEMWRDSVWKSIWDLGTPLKYDQTFNVTYTFPSKLIPALDWTTLTAAYNGTYNWDKGAYIDEEIEVGNTIKNQRQIDFTGRFNMESLYNKSKYLKEVNQRFSSRKKKTNTKNPVREKPKKFEKVIDLYMDSLVRVTHNLDTKKPRVSARRLQDSLAYAIKFKPMDKKSIKILNKDSISIKVTVLPPAGKDKNFWTEVGQYTTRFLMMVRNVNLSYTDNAGLYLSGFRPGVGDILGQSSSSFGFAPGGDFAFGFTGENYLDRARENGWLLNDSNNINPAIYSAASNLTIRAQLEPIKGLKIDLNATRVHTRNKEFQYVYDEDPLVVLGGNFTMSTVAISSAFESMKASNNYASKSFNTFREYRDIIASRLNQKYSNVRYPDAGFMRGNAYVGKSSAENWSVNRNSADVLVPAFIAAYTGKNPQKVQLSAFPSLSALIPNWKITYDGLNALSFIQEHFKSVTFTHQYRCTYSVGAFSSFLNWVQADGEDGLGFIRDITTGNPTPSSPYDISAVSINEAFSPLIGVNMSFKNNLTARAEIKNTRNLSLNMSSLQIVEAVSKEVVLGLEYKVAEFNKVLNMKPSKDYSNDLLLRADFSLRNMQSVIRRIEENYSQSTSGTRAVTMKFSADYALSKMLTLRAFYDLQINKPLVSSSSYPTSNSNYGVSLRFSLQR
ncbi:MAG: cell surface protein SprA [Bacteroidales bacterium]|nr:cell surface protein SprA [Bacteroidales bacterium]